MPFDFNILSISTSPGKSVSKPQLSHQNLRNHSSCLLSQKLKSSEISIGCLSNESQPLSSSLQLSQGQAKWAQLICFRNKQIQEQNSRIWWRAKQQQVTINGLVSRIKQARKKKQELSLKLSLHRQGQLKCLQTISDLQTKVDFAYWSRKIKEIELNNATS